MYLGIGASDITAEILEAILGAFKTKFGAMDLSMKTYGWYR